MNAFQKVKYILNKIFEYKVTEELIDNGTSRYQVKSLTDLLYAMERVSEVIAASDYCEDEESYTFSFSFNNEENKYYLIVDEW